MMAAASPRAWPHAQPQEPERVTVRRAGAPVAAMPQQPAMGSRP